MATFDPAFEMWLQTLRALGYDRLWITNNIEVLRKRYRDTKGAEMPRCPDPTPQPYDPYKGL
ncbi:hypothetical protein [Novosphingobium sp. PY1]|nr:hypothetical protein [Novosphingobium sp. PY1]